MNIGILSRNSHLYSTKRLVEAATTLGHRAQVVDTLSVVVELVDEESTGLVKVLSERPRMVGASAWGMSARSVNYLPPLDAIIPRIGTTITEYGLAVVRHFESRGVFSTAVSSGIAQSRDKLASLQLMKQLGLAVPNTFVIEREESLGVAMRALGGPPAIIKLTSSTQGRGVILVRNMATAVAVYRKLRHSSSQLLMQEFLPEAKGRDTRIFVVGEHCVAAMQRKAAQGDFRSNLHLGGTAVRVHPTPEQERLALAATRAHGLHIAGVDLIYSNKGYLVLEVNSSPGLEGIENCTGVNIAEAIVTFIEKSYAHSSTESA